MPISFFPSIHTNVRWGDISGTLSEQADLQSALNAKSDTTHDHDADYTPISHAGDANNPHSVTKDQVSLGNVTDDAQLKRASGDFNSFTDKSQPDGNDLLLIEDSGAGNAKKKLKLENLPVQFSLEQWVDAGGTRTGVNTFTFAGSGADAERIIASLFTCLDSLGSVKRIGYVKSAAENAGTVTVTVVTDSDLAAGDQQFRITPHRKINDYAHVISIPGELVADALNSQGAWLLDVKYDSFLLPVDSAVRTPASGLGAACAWNIYKNTQAMFTHAQDLGTNAVLNENRPADISLTAGDNLSLRITNVGGDSVMPADFQCKLYVIPQAVFA